MKIIKKLTSAARAVAPLLSTQIKLTTALALLALPARADTFGSGTNTFTIKTVEVSAHNPVQALVHPTSAKPECGCRRECHL